MYFKYTSPPDIIDEAELTWVIGSELDSIWRILSPDHTCETRKMSDPFLTFSEPRVRPKQIDFPTKSVIAWGKISGSSICIFKYIRYKLTKYIKYICDDIN